MCCRRGWVGLSGKRRLPLDSPQGEETGLRVQGSEEGGREPRSESLAEAGMLASRGGESPWRPEGKDKDREGEGDGEREKPCGCTAKREEEVLGGTMGWYFFYLGQPGSFKTTGQGGQREKMWVQEWTKAQEPIDLFIPITYFP